jgi:hypothetical protein
MNEGIEILIFYGSHIFCKVSKITQALIGAAIYST